ncbi:MAG TPA: hypothetical protein VK207_08930 [Bacteroidales bacterium]|nr:hypothetical protein [Bacteroidales bacterium]
MGTFKIEITAVGGHGQDRSKKEGEKVNFYEGGNTSPDALAKTFVENLRGWGNDVQEAKITHWPGEPGEVVDDLKTCERKGNF